MLKTTFREFYLKKMTILLCKMPTEGELFYIYISHMVSIGSICLKDEQIYITERSKMKEIQT